MFKKLSLFALIAIVISSCSSEEKKKEVNSRKISEYVSAVINSSDDVIAFGSISVKGILDKTDYKNDPMLDGFLSEQVTIISKAFNINTPVYFVVQGPMNRSGELNRAMFFIDVKNAKFFKEDLSKNRGYLVDKAGDIMFAEDDEIIIGFRNDLAIAVYQSGKYDGAKLIKEVFKKSQGKVSGGEIDKMLLAKGDVVMNFDMGNAYETMVPVGKSVSAKMKKSSVKMMKGSFIQSSLNFNKGSVELNVKNKFSKELKKMAFFKSDGSSKMASKLSKGNDGNNVIAGLSMNVDIKQLEEMYSEYAPEAIEQMKKQLKNVDGIGSILNYMGAGNILSSLLTGEAGGLLIGDNGTPAGSRMLLGSTDAGKKMFMLAKGEMDLPEEAEYQYVDGGIEMIMPSDDNSASKINGSNMLTMPKGSENFGKKGFTMFVNFEAIETADMAPMQVMILEKLDYLTFEADNDGTKVLLMMKNQDDNFLKQAVETGMMVGMQMMGGM